MKPITFDRRCYRIDGVPITIYSGEFHYFRVPKEDWRFRMRLFKDAGGNCLATYIPWLIHEPLEGQFVFGGETGVYDLEGFLKMARDEGLYVVARPGPYQYSELKYDGLPAWLCDNYPQLHAHDINGKSFRTSSVSYLHPLFLDKARLWFNQVCPLIERHTVDRDGSVAFVQVDNEMGGIHWWISGNDYNADAMGFGRADGYFSSFLRHRYGSVAELNKMYESDYESFDAVWPVPCNDPASLPTIRMSRDYYDFYRWGCGEYGRRLAEMIRSHGINTPIVHNSPNPASNAQFTELVAMVEPPFILGSDHYYNLGPQWKQNNPTPQYALQVFYSNEILRLFGFPPTVYELPGGSLSDWPPILASDVKACSLANVALGMKGANYYIYTGGPNPPGVGTTTDIYDYNAPVGPYNEIRPHYYDVKEVGLFLKHHPWLAEAEREADCRFAFDFESARAEHYWKNCDDFLLSPVVGWEFMQTGALTSAFCGSLSPNLINLDSDDWVEDVSTPLIVPCSSVMGCKKQERVVQFLTNGGNALLGPVLPTHDEDLTQCSVLANYLGNPKINKNAAQFVRLTVGGVVNIYNSGEVFTFENLPANSSDVGVDEMTGNAVAWQTRTVGGGKAIILGFRWVHQKHEHSDMLVSLLKSLGLQQKVIGANPNLWTSLRTCKQKSMLFIMNLYSAAMETTIECKPEWHSGMINLGRKRLDPMTVEAIELPVIPK